MEGVEGRWRSRRSRREAEESEGSEEFGGVGGVRGVGGKSDDRSMGDAGVSPGLKRGLRRTLNDVLGCGGGALVVTVRSLCPYRL